MKRIDPLRQPDRIINYWKQDKIATACIVIFGLGFNIATILGPIYQGKLIDALVRGDSLISVLLLTAVYLLLITGIQLMRYLKRFYTRRFANSTASTMRLMIYNNIMHKNLEDLGSENTGNLMTRAISDVDLCVEGMRKFTTEVFDTGVLMASYLVAMLTFDVKITVLSCLFIPLAMILAEKLKAIIYVYSMSYRTKSSEVAGTIYDAIENAVLYRVNGVEARNRHTLELDLKDLQDKAVKANILETSMQPVYNVIAMLGVIVVIYLGGNKVIAGGWTVGAFSAYLTMFAALALKASKAANLFNSVQKSQVSWERIKPYLTEYQTKETTLNIEKGHTNLRVDGLSFRYPFSKGYIIENISFTAKQGEIVGITGPVAAGKSSLGIALLGLYPYEGSIKIDGRELKDYTEYERSKMISYMGHDPGLLSDTIYNNITLGDKLDISEVLKDVCFDADFKAMPDGESTRVGNRGIRLSGGQQARIALARALLRKNKIIILDDPFSAVDMRTEEQIIANLRTHYPDSLIILISHRLAIFDRIDKVILLNTDRTVEYGSHREMMEKSEIYATIYNLQRTAGDSNG